MMMKLMKFLVVALVAGGVCAPALSQAGEVDGKAVMCKYVKNWAETTYTDEAKAQGFHLKAYHFVDGGIHQISIGRGVGLEDGTFRTIERESIKHCFGCPALAKYKTSPSRIHWDFYSLDRKTLVFSNLKTTLAHCELIHPNEIDAYFQPYVDYGNDYAKARDEKAREGNKL